MFCWILLFLTKVIKNVILTLEKYEIVLLLLEINLSKKKNIILLPKNIKI